MQRRWKAALSAMVLVALAACGGGGGDSGGSGNLPTPTGLVPTAPAPGATLYTDATVLRPLHEGASWTYQGSVTADTGAAPVDYSTVTTQTGVSASGATETETNSGNQGRDSQQLSVSGGTVSWPQFVDLTGSGVPGTLTFVEFRSPMHTNDQYTIYDQRITNSGVDIDGDGKADALDLAIYVRVIGPETLDLPNGPGIATVRVDTTVLSRGILSSNGQATAVVQGTVQTWYAEGIGIVRQLSTVPSDTGTGVQTTDEQLVSWTGF